jgi:transposase InsO family protein
LIRDRDDKFGAAFDALARATGIRIVHTAVRAPNMNAVCERFLGSLRRECLDHVLVLDSAHFHRVVAAYVRYHNAARPHQGIHQLTPVPAERPVEGNAGSRPATHPRNCASSRRNLCSDCWTRTSDPAVNSRLLYQLS